MKRAKVALLHTQLGYGGSEHVTLSIAEALQEDYEVSLITTRRHNERVDLERLNSFCDTAVDERKVTIIEAPLPEFLRTNFAALRGAVFARFCRRLAPEFDVMFMTYGVMDFGVRGIQLIHDPNFNPELHRQLTPFPRSLRGWFYQDSPLRKLYLGLSRRVTGYSEERVKKNLTLVSSEWTARIVRNFYGIETRTVYPAVAGNFPAIAWPQREDGFVCAGRWSIEKRMERVVRILGEVRKRGASIHLHLIGSGGDPRYVQSLRQLCRENQEWVIMEEGIDSQAKSQMMAGHKYGLSGRENEPFGIAVAELAKAGCIVFVPNAGGQVEIVNHPALIYESDDEAVRKIEAVLADSTLATILRTHLVEGTNRFSVDSFRRGIRKIVIEFLQEKKIAREANHQREPFRHLPFRHQITRIAGLLGVRSTLGRLYRRCFAPGGGEHVLSVAGKTARFYVYSESNIEALRSLGGERPTLEFLIGKLQRGDCVWDIGAATGLYTVLLAKAVGERGEVVAFEPADHTYERLREHLDLNQLTNVRAFRLALGDVEGSVRLSLGTVAGSSRIVQSAERRSGGETVEWAKVVNGDRLVEAQNLRVPRAVKIDVEGYELAVIRGLSQTLAQPRCELVCCEVHPAFLPASETPEGVLDLLRSLGFHRIEIHPRTNDFHAWAFKDAEDSVPWPPDPEEET